MLGTNVLIVESLSKVGDREVHNGLVGNCVAQELRDGFHVVSASTEAILVPHDGSDVLRITTILFGPKLKSE